MAYQTKQQQAVLRCLQLRAEECLSAADLSEELRHGGLTVGLATVYRQLDKLTQQGWSIRSPRRKGRSTNTALRPGIPMTAFCCGVRAVGGWSIWTAGTWRRSAAICPPNTTFALTPAAPC